MTQLRLGCIADDYTGATDLCSMLVRAGRRVIQCFGIPHESQLASLQDADALVVALKSRSVPANEAVRSSLQALAFLQSWGADRFFFKYCSTFDSTADGNIGPVADALANILDINQTWFCPAFPENGRTVHCGHLFVNGSLLNESGMQNHPLNPMTDSNLVRVLQSQSARKVDWCLPGANSDEPSAKKHFIVDAVSDNDLHSTAESAKHHVLLTGGSAIAQHWAESAGVRKSGAWLDSSPSDSSKLPAVILAGSCSDATREQVAEFEKSHAVLHLPIGSDRTSDQIVEDAIEWCSQHFGKGPMLVASGVKDDAVAQAQEKWGPKVAAERTEEIFAGVASGLYEQGIRKLIVAGGETSGSVINALKIDAVQIGGEIAPGVPWVTTIREPKLSLALKSGNFGGPRFFFDALDDAQDDSRETTR